MSFMPEVGECMECFSQVYTFTVHPIAKGMPYGQSGRRATVYQLRSGDGKYYALKVFAEAFRSSRHAENVDRLRPFAGFPGLQACDRRVLTPQNSNELIKRHPELTYAVLMPWIGGETWQEFILSGQSYSPEQSLQLGRVFIGILSRMEQEGLAHCDLAGPNVMLNLQRNQIFLVDVDDLYAPSLPKPEKLPGGSAGYDHRTAHQGVWGADADRFAGAVLLVEMLTWHVTEIRQMAYGEQFFAPDEMQIDCGRYRQMVEVLRQTYSSALGDLFARAWESQRLSECPSLHAWNDLMSSLSGSSGKTVFMPPSTDKGAALLSGDGQILPTFKPVFRPIDEVAQEQSPSSPPSISVSIPAVPAPALSSPSSQSSSPPMTKKKTSWAWAFVFLLAGLSVLLGIFYAQSQQDVNVAWNAYHDARATLDVLEEQQQKRLGMNYFRITLNDFYNQRTLLVKNTSGEEVGRINLTYGWYYGENKPQNQFWLVTVLLFLQEDGSSDVASIGFATSLQDKYAQEERRLPISGNAYTMSTPSFQAVIRVIQYEKYVETASWGEPTFGALVLDVVVANK